MLHVRFVARAIRNFAAGESAMEPKVIVPTVGRKVWFWPSKEALRDGFHSDGKQPCDASICFVHSNWLVNISYADQCGDMHSMTAVTLVQPGEPRVARLTGDCFCEWMPYQIDKAISATVEVLSARVDAAAIDIINAHVKSCENPHMTVERYRINVGGYVKELKNTLADKLEDLGE